MTQLMLVFVYLFSFAWPLQQSGLEERAVQFITMLDAGQYEQAAQQFDETMLAAVPPERLQSIWQETIAQYGALQGTGEIRTEQSGEYTAVIVQTEFERAVLNTRVVFDAQGKIAGLFFVPSSITQQPQPASIAGFAISGLFVILLPIVLANLARRRWRVSWKFFAFGAGIFIVFQLLTRIPLVGVLGSVYGGRISASSMLTAAWIFVLSLTAGLFEEFGRLIGYRWLFQAKERTWKNAVMYGLGHGGIEAIVLVGISQLSTAVLLATAPTITSHLPAEQLGPVMAQIAAAVGVSPLLPFLGAFERVAAIALHVALSVLVLQVFRRGSSKWLWLAILLHTITNLVIVGGPIILHMSTDVSRIFSTVMLALVGASAVWIIRWLKEPDSPIEGTNDPLATLPQTDQSQPS